MQRSRQAIAQTLSHYRFGANDPTSLVQPGQFWRATVTPDGAGSLCIDFRGAAVVVSAWGPGGDWLVHHAKAMTGELDDGFVFVDAHPVIMAAQREHPHLRLGASFTLYHELIATVLGQRVTAGEGLGQWRRLVLATGRRAPGPVQLLLPPLPDELAGRPAWWFHPLGIETKRAATLRVLGRHAAKLFAWSELPPVRAAEKLALLPGVGPWTIGSALSTALGDPDSIAVGDYHLKNIVGHALTGAARSSDERMLELLEPYRGQRGRVVKLLLAAGHRAPRFGPRQRVLQITRW